VRGLFPLTFLFARSAVPQRQPGQAIDDLSAWLVRALRQRYSIADVLTHLRFVFPEKRDVS
jgi:hypothetical protein